MLVALGALLRPLPAAPRPPPEPRRELESPGERLGPPPTLPRDGRLQPGLAGAEVPGRGGTGLGGKRDRRGHLGRENARFWLWQPSAGRIKPRPAEIGTFAACGTSFSAANGAVQGTRRPVNAWAWTCGQEGIYLSFGSGCRGVTRSPQRSPQSSLPLNL